LIDASTKTKLMICAPILWALSFAYGVDAYPLMCRA